MAEPALSAVIDLTYSGYWLLVWTGAGATGFLYHALARHGLGAARSAGLGLMSVPVWMAFWSFVDSISVLADPDSVLRAIPRPRLSRIYAHGIVRDVGYLGLGFVLWTQHVGFPRGLRDLAGRLRDEGFPMGRSGREGTSALHGYALFPVLLLGTYLVNLALRGSSLQTGDESQLWNNLTVYHVAMISLTAAFTEELVYRVFLLASLRRLLGRWMSERAALWTAVAVQAVAFGFAHAGYGTWSHVLLPTLFGLLAGVAAVRFGLWAPVVLHLLVDVYALGAELFSEVPLLATVLLGALVVNLAVAVLVAAWSAYRLLQRARPVEPA